MKYLLIAFTLIFGLTLNGQETFKPVNDVKLAEETFKSASAKIKTIKSDFVQEKHLQYLSATIISKGKFWFSKPGSMRWEYTEPFQYKVIINNGQLNIDDAGKKNQIDLNSNKAFKELNEVMISSVNGELIGNEKFNIEMLENSGALLVKLSPKDEQMKEVLSNIHLYISKNENTVYKIKMVETQDDFTIISFNNRITNAQIPASVYQAN